MSLKKNWRINLILALILLFGAAIIYRLVCIQVIQHGFYKALAQGQHQIFQTIRGERGEIFFKGGEPLAKNTTEKFVFIVPLEISDKEKVAENLSQIIDLEKDLISEKIEKDGLFEKIKSGLTDEQCGRIRELNLTGVYLSEASARIYPQDFMASRVIGFLGGEQRGQYGIEDYYDELLRGRENFKKGQANISQYFLKAEEKENRGSDIFLTLDYNIQFISEKLLEKAKEQLNIDSGQIIVVEPKSGKILSLANYPNFNPNDYWEAENFQIFQNPAIQNLFEPGSVFKPITMAGALDQGKITPQTVYLDEGEVKVGRWTIYNYGERVFNEQTMTQVLEKSINTGAVFVEKQLGDQFFLDYLGRFGFFEPTGIDLEGEVFSENEELKKGYQVNFCTASFGQGIEITPIQLVRAFSAIANSGKLARPYLVEKIYNGDEIIETEPQVSEQRIISQKTASQLTAMLVSVVENGFAKGAKIPGYYIAGKTGTAQVPWSSLGINEKGYSDKTWQSFIGFGPAFDSKFLILIKLDNPETKTAEYSAVPIFQELAKYLIDYLGIPPDYEY